MKKLNKNIILVLLLAGFVSAGFVSAANAEVVVIVNPANATSSMTNAEVTKLFTGAKSGFADGSKAEIVTNKGAANDAFLSKVLGKTQAQLKATWARIVFSGSGLEPQALGSDTAVKKFVASNPKAIGYIDASAVDGTVKAVYKAE
jgi:ABC-type phosphate transport system substrate-binding protein